MYGFTMTDATYQRFQTILDYMNELEKEYRSLYNLGDEKSVRDREWVDAKISGAREMFDLLNTCPQLYLTQADDEYRWTFKLDISAFTHKEEF